MAEYIERERTCKNCVHNDACRNILTKAFSNLTDEEIEQASIRENRCHFFKPAADVAEVRHREWVLTPHEENTNYRWSVTAECSECHFSKGEIYAGFFPNFPKNVAQSVVLDYAKAVKLDNYCPNCGAKMDGKER